VEIRGPITKRAKLLTGTFVVTVVVMVGVPNSRIRPRDLAHGKILRLLIG
jgi:hypothetical protein